MTRGILIILSGPSGVGKGTVRQVLFEHQELGLHYSISMTTRKPRPGEVDGRDYFFVDQQTFEKTIAEDGFLEYATFVSHSYGTPKAYVEKLLEEGKNVLLEIEMQGALQVMKKCPDALSIFLLPPSLEELERRIRHRGTEAEEVIRQRMETARKEMNMKNHYQYQVVNQTVEQASNEIAAIILKNMKK